MSKGPTEKLAKNKTLDDAGREVDVIDARRASESDDPALRELVKRAVLIQQQKAFGKTLVVYVLLMVGGAVAALLVATSLQLKDPWPQLCAVACAGIWIVPLLRTSNGSLSGTLTTELLTAGRCGSCGYSLHDLSEAVAELATCPECGASWRKSRFTRVASSVVQPTVPEGAFAFTAKGIRVLVIDLDRKGFPAPHLSLPGAESGLGKNAHELRRELRRRILPRRLGQTLFTLCVAFVTAMVLVLPPSRARWRSSAADGSFQPTTAVTIGLIAVGLALTFQLVRIWRGRTAGQRFVAKRVLIEHGLCGSCARELRAAQDGETYLPCEGCGARWSVFKSST